MTYMSMKFVYEASWHHVNSQFIQILTFSFLRPSSFIVLLGFRVKSLNTFTETSLLRERGMSTSVNRISFPHSTMNLEPIFLDFRLISIKQLNVMKTAKTQVSETENNSTTFYANKVLRDFCRVTDPYRWQIPVS